MANLLEQIRECLSVFTRLQKPPALVARRLLSTAKDRDTPIGRLRVISAEGLVAFKLQGYVNDPTRDRDLHDTDAGSLPALVDPRSLRGATAHVVR